MIPLSARIRFLHYLMQIALRIAAFAARAVIVGAILFLGSFLTDKREAVWQISGVVILWIATIAFAALFFSLCNPVAVTVRARVPHTRRLRVYRWGAYGLSSLAALAGVAVLSPAATHPWLLKWLAIPMSLGYLAAAWILAGWYCVARDEDRESILPPPRHLVFHFVKVGGGGGRFPVEKRMLIPSDESQTEADLALLQQKLRAKYPDAHITL